MNLSFSSYHFLLYFFVKEHISLKLLTAIKFAIGCNDGSDFPSSQMTEVWFPTHLEIEHFLRGGGFAKELSGI